MHLLRQQCATVGPCQPRTGPPLRGESVVQIQGLNAREHGVQPLHSRVCRQQRGFTPWEPLPFADDGRGCRSPRPGKSSHRRATSTFPGMVDALDGVGHATRRDNKAINASLRIRFSAYGVADVGMVERTHMTNMGVRFSDGVLVWTTVYGQSAICHCLFLKNVERYAAPRASAAGSDASTEKNVSRGDTRSLEEKTKEKHGAIVPRMPKKARGF